ncbi:ParA family protein [Citrobacter braakii]|nr:ParA family protein [Citrobacter braakii]ELK6451491.1 ParA family protein [Citrobacter freundii]
MAIYAIAHNKGGAGKTTSSVHILGELGADEVLDLDIHTGISVINTLRPDDKKWSVTVVKSKEELLQLLEKFDGEGKDVFIDCGGFDSDLSRTAVAVADLVIVPANDSVPEQIGLVTFDQTLDEVSQQMDIDIQAYLLLCKTHPNQKNFAKLDDVLSNMKHIKLLESKLPWRTGQHGFQDSLSFGLGITEIKHGRSSTAGKEVVALVKELKALVKEKMAD